MKNILFRCSSIGKLMTEPKTQKEGPLSVGAKTYIRELAAQEIFGIDFEISGKQLEKGIACESEAIDMLNRVRGLDLVKNSDRRQNGLIAGECDAYDPMRSCGHDIKCAWSAATFPISVDDCKNSLYEWQMRGYMWLWGAPSWEVNYCLVNTPERLIGFEPIQMHIFDHIEEWKRITTWRIERDTEKEKKMEEKIHHARAYFDEVVREFDNTHRI